MRSLPTSLIRLAGGLVLVALLSVTFVRLASADDSGGSGTVTGGNLTVSVPATTSFSGVTINGTNQTSTATLIIGVNDDTGTGAGWNLQVNASQFDDGNSHTLATNALRVNSATSASNGAGTYTAPTSNVSTPVALTAGAASKFFNAAVDSGLGHFNITTGFQLTVPANVRAGTYTSTITITLTSAP